MMTTSPASNAASVRFGTVGAHRPGRRRVRATTVMAWVTSILAVLVVAGALAFQATGGRWFVIETPSMGPSAPVGSLIIAAPTTIDGLSAGDVISFHPPTSPSEVYTHRIVSVDDGGITTRGDINGVNDPWTLTGDDLIGETISILPIVGWVLRALPYLIVGSLVVWIVTRFARTATTRASARIVGLSLVASATAFFLRPLVGVTVLATTATTRGATAEIVSTGVLPVRVQAVGGSSVDLVSGQVGYLRVPTLAADEMYRMSTSIHLPPWGWVVMGIACALPLVWCLVVGLPGDEDERPEPHPARIAHRARRPLRVAVAR